MSTISELKAKFRSSEIDVSVVAMVDEVSEPFVNKLGKRQSTMRVFDEDHDTIDVTIFAPLSSEKRVWPKVEGRCDHSAGGILL